MSWLKAVAASAFAVLAPVHTVMAVAGILLMVDTISGIAAAIKRKEAVTSAGLRRTLTKAFVYEFAIMIGFLAEHYMLGDSIPVVKLIAAAIAMVEVKSCLENLNEINGAPIFKSIITSLGSKNDDPPPPPTPPSAA